MRRTGRTKEPSPCLVLCLLCAVCLLFSAAPGRADTAGLVVSLPDTVKGYTPCEIIIQSPAAGEAELKLLDQSSNLWLTRKEQIEEGKNVLAWDGLGEYGERMFAGPYRFEVALRTTDGRELTAKEKFTINGTTQTLVYALPSSETLYLDGGDPWFVECFVSAECIVAMEMTDRDGKRAYYREDTIKDPDGSSIRWAGTLSGSRKIAPGEYTVKMWSKLNPKYQCSFPLKVEEQAPPKPEIAVTGPVIPERGMSDAEIWEIMMKPSVVIDANGTFRQFSLYSQKNTKSRSNGILKCALQGLEILEVEGYWARVRAWRHEDGTAAEGYLPLYDLTVYYPAEHYGVLIDKRDQTLTVYQDGKPIGTVPVSTGLVVKRQKYRETPPGAFLTDVHTGSSFAQDGYRYEYPLRYDGGNFIHGLGFTRKGRARDYSHNLPLLGQKASHGCTRVSLFLQEGNPINMYWLWIHLPYHTRVIVLDD